MNPRWTAITLAGLILLAGCTSPLTGPGANPTTEGPATATVTTEAPATVVVTRTVTVTKPSPPTSTSTPTPKATSTPMATSTAIPQPTPTVTPTPTPDYNETDFREELTESELEVKQFEENETGYVLSYTPAFGVESNRSRERAVIASAWLHYQANTTNSTGYGLYVEKVTARRTTYRDVEVLAGTPILTFQIRTEWAAAYLDGYLAEEEFTGKINATVREPAPPDYTTWLSHQDTIEENSTHWIVTLTVTNDGAATLDVQFGTTVEYGSNRVKTLGAEGAETTLDPGESVTVRHTYDKDGFLDGEPVWRAYPNGVIAELS